jgi:MBG domain (YGX type)
MNASFAAPLKPKSGFSLIAPFLAVAIAAISSAGVASAAPAIKVLRGANQQTTYASAFPAPLVVWVTDPATQRSISDFRVNFTAGAGIELGSTYAITDEHGLASVTATGLTPGVFNVIAELAELPDVRVNFEGLEVDKATLTVVPADLLSTVDGVVPPIINYTIKGFVNGDTEATAQVTGTPVLTTTAHDHSPHANYAIKGGVGSLAAPNYNFVAGFGTLAVVGGSNSGNVRDQAQETSIAPSGNEDAIAVRAALMDQSAPVSMIQPGSIAGFRGDSEILVRTAIEQRVATVAVAAHASSARSAMAVVVADNRKAPDAPVRAGILPKLTLASAAVPSAKTHSAMSAVVADNRKTSAAPVHAVILAGQPATATAPVAGSSIRKAFNP